MDGMPLDLGQWAQTLAVIGVGLLTAMFGAWGVCHLVRVQVDRNTRNFEGLREALDEVKQELDEHVKESIAFRSDVAVLKAEIHNVHKRLDRINGVK